MFFLIAESIQWSSSINRISSLDNERFYKKLHSGFSCATIFSSIVLQDRMKLETETHQNDLIKATRWNIQNSAILIKICCEIAYTNHAIQIVFSSFEKMIILRQNLISKLPISFVDLSRRRTQTPLHTATKSKRKKDWEHILIELKKINIHREIEVGIGVLFYPPYVGSWSYILKIIQQSSHDSRAFSFFQWQLYNSHSLVIRKGVEGLNF